MSVEIWILIAIAIFGAVSIFISLSIKSAVQGTERQMWDAVQSIAAVRRIIDERVPRASDPHYDPQHFVLNEIKENTANIIAPKTLRFELDRVSEKIGSKVDWVRQEIVKSRPSGNFPYEN